MNSAHASRTAEYMALFRALESNAPARQRLFTDTFAQDFLSPSLRLLTRAARWRLPAQLISRLIDWRWPGARTSAIARTRFIDEAFLQAARENFEQFVILGSGYDARAYRLQEMQKKRVFEVDAPETLHEKQRVLSKMFSVLPAHVTFVAVDFTRQDLAEELRKAGFASAQRTFFLWEGVTNYLTAEAVDAVFRFVSTIAPESRVLFTYVHRAILEQPATFAKTRSLARTLQQIGEPWTFGFDPAELPSYLEQRGLLLRTDTGSVEYRTRYLGPQARYLRGYAFYRLALAEVSPDTPLPAQGVHLHNEGV